MTFVSNKKFTVPRNFNDIPVFDELQYKFFSAEPHCAVIKRSINVYNERSHDIAHTNS